MDKTAAASIAGKAPTAPGRFWPEGWWRVMEIRIGIIPLPVFIVMGILISVEGANSAAALGKALGQSVRPIPLGSELLASFYRPVQATGVPQAMAERHRCEAMKSATLTLMRSQTVAGNDAHQGSGPL